MFYHFQDRDENPRLKLLQNENVKRGENTKPLEGGEEGEEKGPRQRRLFDNYNYDHYYIIMIIIIYNKKVGST